MRRRLVICVLALPALVPPPAADASCAATVVVGKRLLFGQGDVARDELPPVGKEHPAVEPACNDEGQDDPGRPITVRTLRGLPPDVAVLRHQSSTELYVAEGSLVVSAAHPLHRAVYARGSVARRGPCRRVPRAVRGRLADESYGTLRTLVLRVGSGRPAAVVRTDERTRLTNRRPYEPVNPGQRLAVRTSVCRGRRVADAIAFVGPTVAADPVETDTGVGFDVDARWIVGGAFAALIAALVLAAVRIGRDT